MRLSVYGYTNRGGRDHNEDSVRCSAEEERGVFVLADGLGGHGKGEVASALAADILFQGCVEAAPDTEGLLELFQRANEAVLEGQKESGQGTLSPGDAFLLCSDGFWEYVYREEMLADLLKAETPEQWAKSMLLRHIRRTPEGNDNFSLICVFVEEL